MCRIQQVVSPVTEKILGNVKQFTFKRRRGGGRFAVLFRLLSFLLKNTHDCKFNNLFSPQRVLTRKNRTRNRPLFHTQFYKISVKYNPIDKNCTLEKRHLLCEDALFHVRPESAPTSAPYACVRRQYSFRGQLFQQQVVLVIHIGFRMVEIGFHPSQKRFTTLNMSYFTPPYRNIETVGIPYRPPY